MKHYYLLLVVLCVAFGCNAQDWPPIDVSNGYVMIGRTRSMTDNSRIWELAKVGSDTIGLVCFICEYGRWYTCDCKTLDSTWDAVRKRYREDKRWRDSIRKADSITWDKWEKVNKTPKQHTSFQSRKNKESSATQMYYDSLKIQIQLLDIKISQAKHPWTNEGQDREQRYQDSVWNEIVKELKLKPRSTLYY